MRATSIRCFVLFCLLVISGSTTASNTVPNEVQLPGTQPSEVSNFEAPNKCDNCHAGYNGNSTVGEPQHEPATGWRGAAMGNAGRDPIFWATMAIAEQDFDGVGDLCIRCHSTGGWYGGRSTPTDASGLATSDSDGVDCDSCHSMTNPDDSEHLGVMNPPFVANCNGDTANDLKCTSGEGFYGSGITSMWAASDKLGPYTEEDASARHQAMQSEFHRSVDFCGTCHDVSNSVVGDLATNHGVPLNAPDINSSQDAASCSGTTLLNGACLGGDINDKAAFNNPPYAYGVVERTFSEYKASALPTTLVSDFSTLPEELRVAGGSLETTYQAALLAGQGGNYADGADRFFSCQSCHMRPTESAGANKRGVKVRKDLPQHDHTGGNYWLADMIKYQDSRGQLRLGGGLTSTQLTAIDLGQLRAAEHLQQAASLELAGDTLTVVNLTGHKLITGYPEGRRMWLNIKWYGAGDILLREDGKYGPIGLSIQNPLDPDGSPVDVESIVDQDDPYLNIYEAHYAVTRDWAATLQALHGDGLVLSYNRMNGEVLCTVGDFLLDDAAIDKKEACKGDHHETFHFALNNTVVKDNRIPPYKMRFDDAQIRNIVPVGDNQYGDPVAGGVYNHWDDIDLSVPVNAVYATIDLLYQGTSWEYVQFLEKANNQQNAFLGQEGVNMLEAWINAEVPVAIEVGGDKKMVPPAVMASIVWGVPPVGNSAPICSIESPGGDTTILEGESISYTGIADDSDGTVDGYLWSFPGGSPDFSTDINPGSISYSTEGIYFTEFTATDNEGLSCATATVRITVESVGEPVNCGDFDNKTACNDNASCKWSGKHKSCIPR